MPILFEALCFWGDDVDSVFAIRSHRGALTTGSPDGAAG